MRPSMLYTRIILVLEDPLPELTKLIAAAINPAIPNMVSIIPNIFFSIFKRFMRTCSCKLQAAKLMLLSDKVLL